MKDLNGYPRTRSVLLTLFAWVKRLKSRQTGVLRQYCVMRYGGETSLLARAAHCGRPSIQQGR